LPHDAGESDVKHAQTKSTHRRRDALRDNGLATAAMILVVAVAVAGWSASFISLHEFATAHMGLKSRPAWLVPSTFDGAALGLSLLAFRAAIYGRASLGSLIFVYGFTGLSSWINWVHIDDPRGRFVASLLPVAAVLVFGKVLREAREAFERRNGKVVFKVRGGLLLLRWFVDRPGTRAAIRSQILGIPVQALIGLGADALARKAAEQLAADGTTETAPAVVPARPASARSAPGAARPAGTERASDGTPTGTAPRTAPERSAGTSATVVPLNPGTRTPFPTWVERAIPLWHAYVDKHHAEPIAAVLGNQVRLAFPEPNLPTSDRWDRKLRLAVSEAVGGAASTGEEADEEPEAVAR
jgi:hypothetical protein